MEHVDFLHLIVSVFGTQSPLLITYLVGIAIALQRWHQHPRVSALAASGCGVLLFVSIAFGAFAAILPSILLDLGWKGPEFGNAFSALNLVRNFFSSLGIGCLVAAAFTRRSVL